MTIEYLIELPCEPKRRFGADGILDRVRIVDLALSPGPHSPKELAASAEAGFELQPVAIHCSRCHVNYLDADFGCTGRILAPISRAAEEWLVELLPDNVRLADGSSPQSIQRAHCFRALTRRLREWNVTGHKFDERRRIGGWTEARSPLVKRYGAPFTRVRVSTSQLFELLFERGEIDHRTAEMLCRTLGLWQDGREGAATEDGLREVMFTTPVTGKDDASVVDLKQYFLALMVACSMDCGVSARYQE